MIPTKPIVSVLALSSLVFASLMPPEAYPVGRMGIVLCATFAFLIALSEKKIPQIFLAAGLLTFVSLLVHSLLISVDTYRSLEFMTVIWAYYCLLGFFIYSTDGSARPFAATVVILAVIVSSYGLYQFFWGFESLQSYLDSVSSAADKTGAQTIIDGRRVFSTFALPGTLWGFLLVALPVHGLLWNRSRWLNALLLASAGGLLATGFLTRSFGFVVGLGILVLSIPAVRAFHSRSDRYPAAEQTVRKILAAVTILAVLAGAAGIFYLSRSAAIDSANPLILRFKSWVSAWTIFEVSPLGTGLNTYGIVYTQYMQPGATETQHAHNTFLQLMSELGYPLILAFMLLVIFLVRTPPPGLRDSRALYLLPALAVWVLHNSIDISIYFPSVGVLGIAVIGVLFSRPQAAFDAPKWLAAAMACLAVPVVVFSGMILMSSELQHRAQIEYENMKPEEAVATLDSARMINPMNPSIYEESGEILLDLYHKIGRPEYLERATAAMQYATELSPVKANPRIWLALCLSSAGRMDAAMEQIHIARELFPSNTRVRAIIRLMEKRINGTS